jgi:hypothetical protein
MQNHRLSIFLAALALGITTTSAGAQSAPAAESATTASTRQVLESYWTSHDPRYVAEDAVFVMLPTGEEIRGRDAIAKHLDAFYHKSLTAHAEVVNSIFSGNKGLLEAVVVGKHTGEFAGIPATGRDVRVPLAVTYEVENGLIKRASIYLLVNVLVGQINAK